MIDHDFLTFSLYYYKCFATGLWYCEESSVEQVESTVSGTPNAEQHTVDVAYNRIIFSTNLNVLKYTLRWIQHFEWMDKLRQKVKPLNTLQTNGSRDSFSILVNMNHESPHLLLILPPGGVQGLNECSGMPHKHGEAGGAHDHAEDGEPHICHSNRWIQTVAYAQHVTHGLEESVGVLLTPSVVLWNMWRRKKFFLSHNFITAALPLSKRAF